MFTFCMYSLAVTAQCIKRYPGKPWQSEPSDAICQHVFPLQALLQQDEVGLSEAGEQSEDGQKASQMSARWQQVAQLLGCKHDRIDSVQALPLLPLQVSRFCSLHSCLATSFHPDGNRKLVGCMNQCEQAAMWKSNIGHACTWLS